ncbi:MAG TPA: phosphoglycerate kinase [Geminicoccaceae bacterium]|nr:phosphoglycerate kinase [Geminicoccaceae bacterium]
MGDIRTLDDLGDVAGRTLLVRLDLNVPMHDGEVTDASRIERSVPTVAELRDKNAKVVVLAHFGRPKGKRESSMSLRPLCRPLGAALGGIEVAFAEDCIGAPAEQAVAALRPGDVLLLENLRFHPGEEKNEPAFADQLARLGERYVDDAFSASHRAHASITGLAERLPSAAGRLMQAEIEALGRALDHPERPLGAVVGGAKVSTKVEVLGNLIEKVDLLVLGGGMANTFLYARGTPVGRSLCEKDLADTAREIMAKAEARNCRIVLPIDGRVASEFKAGARSSVVPIELVPEEAMILDIGPGSAEQTQGALARCKTLVWNGPLGAFEIPPFDAGTTAVARMAAERTQAGKLMSVAGGGDTLAALAHAGVLEQFSYVSTAGGAFLEWLEGKELPGVAVLKER